MVCGGVPGVDGEVGVVGQDQGDLEEAGIEGADDGKEAGASHVQHRRTEHLSSNTP